MKISLRVLFLCLFFISVRTIAQDQKGSLQLNPQAIVNQWKFKSDSIGDYQSYVIGSSFHYYVSNKLALGFWLNAEYHNFNAKDTLAFSRWTYVFLISPELHYRFLTSRFSPFLRIRLGEFGYIYQFRDNPAIPERQRRTGNFIVNDPLYRSSIGLGCMYSLKGKLVLTAQCNVLPFQSDYLTGVTVGIGCLFTLTK